MKILLLAVISLLFTLPRSASAQDSLPSSRITNAGVVRAVAATDSVFISRTRLVDTVDIGDFTSSLLAQIGAPRFADSLQFRVSSDSQRVRISGRLMDFPSEYRKDLGAFSFLDSTSVFVAEVSMPQADSGIMVFRLERLSVRGLAIPDLLVLMAMEQFRLQYPKMLAAGGREFHVQMPPGAHARLIGNAIVLSMPARQP